MRGCLIAVLCLLEFLHLPTSHGQMRMCSQVYCIHELDVGGDHLQRSSSPKVFEQGKQGPIGPPGTVNYTKIEESLKKKYEELEAKLEEKMRRFESQLKESLIRDQPRHPAGCKEVCQKIQNGEEENQPVGFAVKGNQARVFPRGFPEGLEVYCDCSSGGEAWTVFQRRMDGSQDFYQNWASHVNGFGSKTGEFWLGLDALSKLASNPNEFELRIDLMSWENEKRFAEYSSFSIGNSSTNFMLTVGGYSGNAGDGLVDNAVSGVHNQMPFTTFDDDNDKNWSNCAKSYHGGWWFNSCFRSHLNGKYHKENETPQNFLGIIWDDWKGPTYSLKATEMKFRQKN